MVNELEGKRYLHTGGSIILCEVSKVANLTQKYSLLMCCGLCTAAATIHELRLPQIAGVGKI